MMMMTINYSRVCGESPRCPWKNCAVQGFDCFQNRALSTAQRHGRQLSQTVTLKIAHAEGKRGIFLRNFFVFQFQIFFATKKIDAQGGLIRVKNRNFSKRKKNKAAFF